jgi:hypothetical protein
LATLNHVEKSGKKNLIDFWKFFSKNHWKFNTKIQIFSTVWNICPCLLMQLVQEYLLQLFSLQSGLCPIFFHLGISRHVLGMLEVRGGHVTCYKTLGTCYPACYMSFGTHNMGGYGCKTWQGGKKTGQM